MPLSTYWVSGPRFLQSLPKDSWHKHLLRSVWYWIWSITSCFNDVTSWSVILADIWILTSCMQIQCSPNLAITIVTENRHIDTFTTFINKRFTYNKNLPGLADSCKLIKVALGVCFALKSWKEYLLLFTFLITLGNDVTLPLITKFKTNRPLSNLFVNRIPN